MHGNGKIKFTNGDWYEGEFKNGKRDGFGTYFYPNGKIRYEGEWKDN